MPCVAAGWSIIVANLKRAGVQKYVPPWWILPIYWRRPVMSLVVQSWSSRILVSLHCCLVSIPVTNKAWVRFSWGVKTTLLHTRWDGYGNHHNHHAKSTRKYIMSMCSWNDVLDNLVNGWLRDHPGAGQGGPYCMCSNPFVSTIHPLTKNQATQTTPLAVWTAIYMYPCIRCIPMAIISAKDSK